MNSYERLYTRLDGGKPDRLPNLSLVMFFAAKLIGVPFGKYVSDYRLLCEGAFRCHEEFGIDMFCAISDPMREAEGFGAVVTIPDDNVPYSKAPLIGSVSDIGKLHPIDPASGRRMNDRLLAVQKMKEKAAGKVPVVGWVEGAIAESCDLMGISEFMLNIMLYPDEIRELLAICYEQAVRFAKAQIAAGADIIGIGDAAASLIGPALYEEFALPYEKKLAGEIHAAGGLVKLHICGNTNSLLTLMADTGADIVDLDHMVDMNQAANIFPADMHICGNFDPSGVLLRGTPDRIREAVRTCMQIGDRNANLIAPGCEVPRDTPFENFLAIREELSAV
ncbi:uroporphyrinogen decarboxylase [Clostridia bacterium]|nr:uroporphyrinogen decarboxylase [Clostridia bacterium]